MESKFFKNTLVGLSLMGAAAGVSGQTLATGDVGGNEHEREQISFVQKTSGLTSEQLNNFVNHDNSMRMELGNPVATANIVAKLQQDQNKDPNFAKKMGLLSQFNFSIVADPTVERSELADGLTGRTYTLHVSPSDLKSDKPILDIALRGIRSGNLNDIKGLQGRIDMMEDDVKLDGANNGRQEMVARYKQQVEAAQKTVDKISEVLPSEPNVKRAPRAPSM